MPTHGCRVAFVFLFVIPEGNPRLTLLFWLSFRRNLLLGRLRALKGTFVLRNPRAYRPAVPVTTTVTGCDAVLPYALLERSV